MPNYEYKCNNCSHQFETFQSIHDDALTECPKCNGKIRRIIGNIGIAFKGSGFYINDSQKKKQQSLNKSNLDHNELKHAHFQTQVP